MFFAIFSTIALLISLFICIVLLSGDSDESSGTGVICGFLCGMFFIGTVVGWCDVSKEKKSTDFESEVAQQDNSAGFKDTSNTNTELLDDVPGSNVVNRVTSLKLLKHTIR